MVTIITLFLYLWVSPIKITPDSELYIFNPPLLVTDNQGRCWFAWDHHDFIANEYYTLARYFENDTLSEPDTVMPLNLVMDLRGLTKNKDGNIWVLGEGGLPSEIWSRYHDGMQWSNLILIPIFTTFNNFISVANADSTGNYWVAWSTDSAGYKSIHSSYYNGTSWSPRMPVSDRPPYDAAATGMITAKNGIIWLSWISLTGTPDSLCISTYNGLHWSTDFILDGNIYIPGPVTFFASSLIDSSVFISYRKTNGTIYVLRFTSVSVQPETIWVSGNFETAPALAGDHLGQLWLFYCDSLDINNYRLFYSIWNRDSVTSPKLVDTLEAFDPRTTFDAYYRRIWVSYKSHRDGNAAIFATYTDLEGINEKGQIIPHPQIGLICLPNPVQDVVQIKFTIPRKVKISLNLYDNSGRLLKKIFAGEKAAGPYSEMISLKNYPAGVYHIILKTSEGIIRRKVVFVK